MKRNLLPFLCFLVSSAVWAQDSTAVLRSIRVEGNRNTQRELIQNTLNVKPGEPYNSVRLQESVRNLYDLGLFSHIRIDTVSNDSGLVLVIKVKEFPVLDHYEVSGNKKVRDEDIKSAIKLNDGQVLTDLDIQNTIRDVRSLYDKEGLLLAQIEANPVPSKENPDKVILAVDINEGKKVQVAKITFAGVSKVKQSKLMSVMKTKEDRWWRSGDFKEEDFDQDVQTIADFYHQKGMLDARVLDYQIKPYYVAQKKIWKRDSTGQVKSTLKTDTLSEEKAKSNLHINIQVYEGPLYMAGRFSFEGNVLFKDARLKKEILLEQGDVFDQNRYELLKYKMQSLYYEEGYIYARFDEKRSYRGDTIDVHFKITEGLPAYVHKVFVEGNLKTREKVIRREITLMPGGVFRQSKLERSMRNIQYLNFFSDVKHDIRPIDEGSVDIIFRVTEREDVGQVSVGVGYSQRDGLVGTASLSIPNFRGAGQKLDLNLERGGVKQNYSLGFSEPWLFDTPTSAGFKLFYSEQTALDATNQETVYRDRGGELSLGRKLRWPDDYFSISGSYQFGREDLGGQNSTVLSSLEGRSILSSGLRSSLSLRLLRDDTDLPQFPNRGSVFYYNPELFGGPLGGDFSFLKHNVYLNWNYPTFWKFTLSTKAQFGYIDGTKISRYHLYRAGGVNYDGIIRGYPEGQFGGALNNGLSLLTFSAAFRFPVIEQQLYLSLFADAGNTYGDLSTIDPTDLKRSVGAGVRLSIPMLGIMGFDAAYGFDRISQFDKDRSGLHYHFQIGKGF